MRKYPWRRRFERIHAGTLTFERFDAIVARAKRIRAADQEPDALDRWNAEELKADYWTDGPLKPLPADQEPSE
jgi:hypothetical protein